MAADRSFFFIQNGSRREEERDGWGTFWRAEGASAPPVSSPPPLHRRRGRGGLDLEEKEKGGDARESERIKAAAVLPFSLVAMFPSCRRRALATSHRHGAAALLPPRLLASRRFASPRKREKEKE